MREANGVQYSSRTPYIWETDERRKKEKRSSREYLVKSARIYTKGRQRVGKEGNGEVDAQNR